jgi:hypothetical protein
MPLIKLQFQPGINKEVTSLAGKGGWFSCDNVRFRSGNPEKIGGWVLDTGVTAAAYKPAAGNFWGIATFVFDWASLAGFNYLGIGTNLKFYVQNSNGGPFNDVTPIRLTSTGAQFSASIAEGTVITVTDVGNGVTINDFVTFSGVASTGLSGTITAAILNAEFQVKSVVSTSVYTIAASVASTANFTLAGGTAAVANYQLITGSSTYFYGTGWNSGGWGGYITPQDPLTGTTFGAASAVGQGVGQQLRTWSASNYGQNLVLNPRGGGIYYWPVDSTPSTYNRAQQIGPTNTNTQNGVAYWKTDEGVTACPTLANFILVSNTSRFVVAYGTDNLGDGVQDPMLISWSDQENITVWNPLPTNQAGNYRLSYGSQIITAHQTRQEILIWTDSALYSQQFLGAPFIWGFQPMGIDISIIGPNAVAVGNNVTFWMGLDKFYSYNGTVQTLPSAMRTYVFDNINLDQSFQIFSGVNEGFSEVWWFYCSANSTTVDSYVIYNYVSNVWSYGSMARTAWTDSSLRRYPVATGYASDATDGLLIYHEVGMDDGTTNPPSPITSFVQSSDVDIGDGDRYGFAWRIIPDITFDGSTVNTPSATMTLWPRQNPGAAYTINVAAPVVTSTQDYSAAGAYYNTQQFTQQSNIRVRGRQMAFRVGSTTLGTAWSLGVSRIDVRPDGRRS